MPVDVLMPVITAAGDEAVVTAWLVDEARPCSEGQMIAEVQAEKIADEVHAPMDGFVVDRVAIGDPIHQGSRICRIVERVGGIPAPAPGSSATVAEAAPAVRASPAAKRLARELGVDLARLTGSGPEGRITEKDVRVAGSPPAASGLRAVIARNMRRSHAETAPVTIFSTIVLGTELPRQLTATVVKLTALTLLDHPSLNGHREGDTFVAAASTNIALAIQTDEGLVAPVIHGAAGRSVTELEDIIEDLAARARTGTLRVDDYAGGTFTVSNLGGYGVDGFTPIINLPQVAILGVGAARRVPVIGPNERVEAGYQMMLSLTFDHAFIDGAPAAEFLRDLSDRLVA